MVISSNDPDMSVQALLNSLEHNGGAFLQLQWSQRCHDEMYHPDILALSVHNRLKHMTLHFSKYVGAMISSANDAERIDDLMVDAFIIALATANALNLNLSGTCEHYRTSLEKLESAPTYEASPSGLSHTFDNFLAQFAIETGRMAKYCESLDHLERGDFGSDLRDATITIFTLILVEGARRSIDLIKRREQRLSNIERGTLFNCYIGS